MKFTSILAIAVMLFNVEAIEVHAHQKSAGGAHIRQTPRALAQAKAGAKSEFNFNKFKKNFKNKVQDVKQDYNGVKDSIDNKDYKGAMDQAKNNYGEYKDDGKAAAAKYNNWRGSAEIKMLTFVKITYCKLNYISYF